MDEGTIAFNNGFLAGGSGEREDLTNVMRDERDSRTVDLLVKSSSLSSFQTILC